MVHGIEQGFQRGQQAAAFLQHRGVANHAVGELLTQFGDDFRRGLGGFRRGLHELADLGDRAARVRLCLGRDVARGLRQHVANLLLPARGARARLLPLFAQRSGHGTERLGPGRQSLLVPRSEFHLQVRRSLGRFRGRLDEPVDLGDCVARMGLCLGRDVAGGLREHVADFLLPARGACARLVPLLAQLGGHGTERLGPDRQPLLVSRGQVRLQVRMRLRHGA